MPRTSQRRCRTLHGSLTCSPPKSPKLKYCPSKHTIKGICCFCKEEDPDPAYEIRTCLWAAYRLVGEIFSECYAQSRTLLGWHTGTDGKLLWQAKLRLKWSWKSPRWEVGWLVCHCLTASVSSLSKEIDGFVFYEAFFLLFSVEVWKETGLVSPGRCTSQASWSPTVCVWEQLVLLATGIQTILDTVIVGIWTTPTWGNTQAAHLMQIHASYL